MEASQGTGRFVEPNPGRMGRKKIQISRIGDERNRQVSGSSHSEEEFGRIDWTSNKSGIRTRLAPPSDSILAQ